MENVYTTMSSLIGELKLVANPQGLTAVLWANEPPTRTRLGELRLQTAHPVLQAATRQLEEYFHGQRQTFDLPLAAAGTPFQQRVWQLLREIPYGETRSYRQLAQQLGNPQAMRAVGAANGRNPLAIITPCHRVIGSSGSLTGFAGGLPVKAFLLALEQRPRLRAA